MAKYIPSDAQIYALEAAYDMNLPLLITGEPGTGKTEMAEWALAHLSQKYPNAFHPEVLRFVTKTVSKASDLFYTYDALSHFQEANLRRNSEVELKATEQFIRIEAFGQAIAYSDPSKMAFSEKFGLDLPAKPLHSVVLIDEVDKAPRDFTNDLLDELLNYRFRIRELPGFEAKKGSEAKIVVILTSNSEKNLPDAFLRRCAFFHIRFPEGELLRNIVQAHLAGRTTTTGEAFDRLLKFFEDAREKSVRKAPATAELIAWLEILGKRGYFEENNTEKRRKMLEYNLSFLVKTKDDLEAIQDLLKNAAL